MRDLAMLLAMLVIIPFCLRNAFASFIVWGWTVAMSINFYLYGYMAEVRYNLVFALLTLTLLLLGKLKTMGKWSPNPALVLLVWFSLHVSVSAVLAYDPNPFNATYYGNFMKSMVYCLLIPVVLTTRLRFHAFVIMLAMGIAFHGLLDGLKLIASGGGHRAHGLPTSMMSDNNHFAVGLAMVLPLLYYLYQYSRNKLVSLGFLGSFVLIVLAILATRSRGGFICISIVAIWLIMTSRRKWLAITMALAGIALVLGMAPEEWFQRIETIKTADQDASFMGRVVAWRISSAIAMANPIFGGGFHALQTLPVWETFKYAPGMLGFIATPEPEMIPRAAHSIYFEVLGDHGIVGLLLFLGILASALWNCIAIRRRANRIPELLWARDLADLLGVSLVAYAVGGAAVSLGYFEIYYMVAMATVALRQHVSQHLPTNPAGTPK